MKIKQIFQKLFIGGDWQVGIREINQTGIPTYKLVEAPKGQWIADPFLYEYEGKHYLFVEQYVKEEQHACLGCYEIIDDVPTNYHVIVKTPYHMSYPCVFRFDGHHYMIPESSANNSIDLYEATEFPFRWEHKKVLLQGDKYVDSTVYLVGGKMMLLSYRKSSDGWYIVQFEVKIEKGELKKISEKKYDSNTGRPAGFIFKENGNLFRPSQDCSKKYGESLIINKVEMFDEQGFEEHQISKIIFKDVNVPIRVQRIHTINRDSVYEVVDLFQEKIDLLHAFRIIKRKYKL